MDLTRCQPFITKYYLENVLSTLAGREYDRIRIKDNRNPYVFFRAVPRRSRFTYEDKRIRETKREDVEEGDASLFITEILSARTKK